MRGVPDSYAPFYRGRGVRISPELARAQHAAYADALRASGLSVHLIEADEAYPDCVFLEDPAVVWRGRALMGRLAPHREGEQPPVEAALSGWHELFRLPDGARLEGGDVLHARDTTYVGLTARTDERGFRALADFLAASGRRVVPVPVEKYLHLKTAVTYLGDGALVAAPEYVNTRHFEAEEVVPVEASELGAANCLRLGRRLLVPAGYPATERRLRRFAERRGVEVVRLNISEFEKGMGSLTCLSIIW
ncbi:MAG TPA: arginine deiminase family protein [Pyrinomonadaceae bacterium]|nr:arginine deiminase family protein [Pyrinomonadaceae bacterium]